MLLQLASVFLVAPLCVASGPAIPSQWSAKYFTSAGMTYRLAVDIPKKRFSFNIDPVNFSFVFGDGPPGRSFNCSAKGFCLRIHNRSWSEVVKIYGFGWLTHATKSETKTVAGKPCVVWSHSEHNVYQWSACVDADGIPREFSATPSHGYEGGFLSQTFGVPPNNKVQTVSVVLGPPSTTSLANPDACAQRPPLCLDQGVTTTKVYRSTGFVTPTPGNLNAADARATASTLLIYKQTYVVIYEVTMSTAFGPYSRCQFVKNRGVSECVGLGWESVGKEAADCRDIDPTKCGQCAPNTEKGNWFSFPVEGECRDGEAIGINGCTWSAKVQKVVLWDCAVRNYTDEDAYDKFVEGVETCPGVLQNFLFPSQTAPLIVWM